MRELPTVQQGRDESVRDTVARAYEKALEAHVNEEGGYEYMVTVLTGDNMRFRVAERFVSAEGT